MTDAQMPHAPAVAAVELPFLFGEYLKLHGQIQAVRAICQEVAANTEPREYHGALARSVLAVIGEQPVPDYTRLDIRPAKPCRVTLPGVRWNDGPAEDLHCELDEGHPGAHRYDASGLRGGRTETCLWLRGCDQPKEPGTGFCTEHNRRMDADLPTTKADIVGGGTSLKAERQPPGYKGDSRGHRTWQVNAIADPSIQDDQVFIVSHRGGQILDMVAIENIGEER